MFRCGEHVGQPPDGADVPVGFELACWWVGWRVPEVQDGVHSIHVLLSEHPVEQIISNAVVEDLAVQSSSLMRDRRVVGLSSPGMGGSDSLLPRWFGWFLLVMSGSRVDRRLRPPRRGMIRS